MAWLFPKTCFEGERNKCIAYLQRNCEQQGKTNLPPKDARRGRESECHSLISSRINLTSWVVGSSNGTKL